MYGLVHLYGKKQKPRLTFSKLKLFSKNLFGSLGGFDWTKVKKYQLACQLRFIAKWIKEDPKSI